MIGSLVLLQAVLHIALLSTDKCFIVMTAVTASRQCSVNLRSTCAGHLKDIAGYNINWVKQGIGRSVQITCNM